MQGEIKQILKVIRNIFYTVFTVIGILWGLIIIGVLISGIYISTKILPMVIDAKAESFNSLVSIKDTTFKHLSDTLVFDNKGELIAEINVGNYEYVKYEDLSPYLIEGYIAVEDKNFKVHNGVDYTAIARAGLALVKNKGEITQGGSTITQQLAKTTLLNNRQTLERKLIEFFLAQEIEKQYNKGEIMEFYVNTIFYGNNCYGVETASNYYFGKSAKDLNPEEAALLIGMSNNATHYNPLIRPEITKEKRDWVLSVMEREGVITREVYIETIDKDMDFVLEREQREEENYLVSYAIYNATLEIMKLEGFEFEYLFENKTSYDEYKERYSNRYSEVSELIRQGGYKLYTSFDLGKQVLLQERVDKGLAYSIEKQENGKYALQGSAVLINNDTGYVEAIVGGRGEDNFNRGFLAIRQPGSAIKPVIAYAPAYDTLEYYPSYRMEDKYSEEGPKNYNSKYIGSVTLREALAKSINTIAFQLLGEIGPNTGLGYLEKMEFGNISHIDKDNGALALGGFTYGVKVVDLAKSYHTIYNSGIFTDKGCIVKIVSEEDGVIYNEDYIEKQVYSPDAAYMTLENLVANVEQSYGLSKGRAVKGVQTASKSGTTNSQKDAWFSGMSPYYTLTVWVGYDTPKATGTYGSGVPGEIWQKAMQEIHTDIDEPRQFVQPETIIEKHVNWKGEIVNYTSSRKDIFSSEMLDREEKQKEEERIAKQKEEEQKITEKVEAEFRKIEYYSLYDYSGVEYLETKEKEIDANIKKLDNNDELRDKLSREKERIFSKFNEQIKLIKEQQELIEGLELINGVDKDLNYIEFNKENIDIYPIFEGMYDNLRDRINKIESDTDRLERLEHFKSLYIYIDDNSESEDLEFIEIGN